MLQCSVVLKCSVLQCSLLQFSAVQCIAAQCIAVQCTVAKFMLCNAKTFCFGRESDDVTAAFLNLVTVKCLLYNLQQALFIVHHTV